MAYDEELARRVRAVIARDGLETWVLPRVEVALELPPKPPKPSRRRAPR